MKAKIYTRTGDKGTTRLVDGTLVAKSSFRVEAYGTIDEANAWIGYAIEHSTDSTLLKLLTFLNHRFFNCSSIVATPSDLSVQSVALCDEDIHFLEQAIDLMEERTGEITRFVLCGGSKGASILHIARTVVRRAERRLCTLAEHESVNLVVTRFLNRASDALFSAARYANHIEQGGDIEWDKNFPIPTLTE